MKRVALLMAVATAGGQAVAQDAWSREQYTSENGLLQNRVHAMEVDAWGGLLIGTEGGLVRFDGENFRQIGIPAPEGLRPSRVLEIIGVPGQGFVVRDAGSRQYHYQGNKLSPITADAPARKPVSRFGGTGSSIRATVRAMDPDSTMEGKVSWPYSVRMVSLGDQRWCIRNDHQLFIYNDTALVDRFEIPSGKWSHLFTIQGQTYILNATGSAFRVDVSNRQCIPVLVSGFPPPEMRDGQLTWRLFWNEPYPFVSIIAADGLYTIGANADGTELTAKHIPLEVPADCRVGGIIWLDKGQAVAIGTDTKGLFLYRRNSMRSLLCESTAEGVNNAYFAQAPYGRDGVVSSIRGVPRMFTAAGCTEERPIIRGFDETAILLDNDQRYWYGRGDTLFTFDLATGDERVMRNDLRPLCFLEDRGSVLIGAANGIFQAKDGVIDLINPMNAHDLASRPTALCTTADGDLWMATCSGVYRALVNGSWEVVPGLAGVCARALALVDDAVFIGTYGSGAFLFKNGKLHQLPMDNEGFLSHVHAFLPDSAGFLWMSTNQGLFRVRRADIDHWVKDTTQSMYMAYYGKRSGIRNSEFNGGCSPAYVRTGTGWVSFPTMDGLVWFRPEEIKDAYPLEPLLIEKIEVDGRKLPIGQKLELPWDHREVVVNVSLAYWGARENAALEYALSNDREGRWVTLRPGQRELRFSTLATGEGSLRIRKVGGALRDGSDEVLIRFSIPAPFYRTTWFIGACVLAAALLFYMTLRLNDARLRRKNLQLERMVRARTGELMEANTVLRRSLEMKEMLVSIISHDIVTPLRFIARVSNGAAKGFQEKDRLRLHDTLLDIAQSSDKLHANAQGLLQWIKRQDGRIELRMRNVAAQPLVHEVLEMERERAIDKGVEIRNEVPHDDVLLTDRNVLSIVLHNLVANALSHTPHGSVTVSGEQDGDTYRFTVADTGTGMSEASLKHARRVQGRGALGAMNEEGERDVQGLGLLIVADLLTLLGASFHLESTKGQGTTATISIPCNHEHPVSGMATSPLPKTSTSEM